MDPTSSLGIKIMTLQTSSFSTLPLDLVEEILSIVPATSLRRLQSTCKQWNVLINDQRFTKKHFDKAKKQFLVGMLRYFMVCSMRLNLFGLHDNIDPSIEVKEEHSLSDPRYKFLNSAILFEVFHCSGLLLCKTLRGLVVWNPCTGQSKWIETKTDDHDKSDKYALGYENNNSCYTYKILKFCDLDTFDLEIYEFNSNSWRVLGSITPDFTIVLNAIGVSIKGNTYWIASHKEEEEEEIIYDFLICFDFTTERFGPRVCLPFKGCSSWDTLSLSCVREEQLSVFFQDDDTSKMEIWMSNNITETKAMSWSHLFKIDLNTHRFGTEVSFFIDEENKVIVCCDVDIKEEEDDNNDIVYIIGEDHYWRNVNIGQRSYRPSIFSYVPSLLHI